MVPQPVTTPSPGTLVSAMPKSVLRCSTNMSNSSKEPSSTRRSMRSRAVSLPRACWAALRFSPPPARASAPLGYLAILLAGLLLGFGVRFEANRQYLSDWQYYLESQQMKSKDYEKR